MRRACEGSWNGAGQSRLELGEALSTSSRSSAGFAGATEAIARFLDRQSWLVRRVDIV